METSEAQRTITRNVRILMATRDMTKQSQLVEALDWPQAKVTKTLNGDRRWSVEDLYEIAKVFGVEPGALLGDPAQLIGAAGPSIAAVKGSVTGAYVERSHTSVGDNAHVIDLNVYRAQHNKGITRTGAPSRSMVPRVG